MIVLALLFSITVFGQVDQGRIVGTVKDSTGAVIPGVTVIVTNDRTGEERSTLTGDRGDFIVAGLKPSEYTVKTDLSGFAPATTKVHLVVGQKLALDLTINPSGITETVNVEAPVENAVDTSSARIGVNVDLREVGNLPINGRQLSQLYLQAPGASNQGSGTYGDIRFSGRAVEQNAIRFDGIEASGIVDAAPGVIGGELPSPFRLQSSIENVQEFRVESNNYPAEFGTGSGGQISVVTKSGANQFHGAVFEYLRNDKLDARNFFDIVGKAPLRMNQFGFSIGGPIVKDKAFFFGSYEGYRLRNGINLIESVPSAAAKARAVALGSATAQLVHAFRSTQAVTLVGQSRVSDFDIVQLVGNNVVNENSASARFDFKLNNQHSLYTRFFRDKGDADLPQSVSGRVLKVNTIPQNGVLALQSTF